MVLKTISPGCGLRASLMLFFHPGTSTSVYSGVTVEGTGSSIAQTTGEVAVVGVASSKSATHPVEAVQVLMFC